MDFVAEYGRQTISLVVVFSLLGLTVWKLGRSRNNLSLAWVARKWSTGKGFALKVRAPAKSLQAVERLALTPQHTLHVLRLHGREMVVATYPGGCTLIEREAENRREGEKSTDAFACGAGA